VGTGRDITERKHAEEALRLSEEKFRSLVESTNDFIWEVDAEGHYTYVSPQIEKLLGDAPNEVLGKTPFDLMPPLEAERVRAAFLDHVAARRPLNNLMNLNRHKDGHLVFLETSGTPILDAAGHFLGYRGIDRDVTERKEAEQERERLIRELEAKNQELERFTYTVSHDLKSPLITIKGFAGALLHDVSVGRQDRVQDDLKRIANATDRMAELLNDLLELSRIGRMMNPPSDVDVDMLLREVVELLAGPATQRKAEITIQPGLPCVRGDRRRLQEVFQNLIENAIHFMGSQPHPRIEVGLRDAGTQPVFYVRDNGVGIEPRYHETVFGLFNKLDSKTAGTGIGLALVRRIIEVHGGRIWVESEGQGRGATFCFTLPLINPVQQGPQP
jgi:PAS domain S-box-containing protein